jgi:hypothetical protein
MKYLAYSLLVIALGSFALTAGAQTLRYFTSVQLAPNPQDGYCLTTNGATSTWAACATGGSGASSTVVKINGTVSNTGVPTLDFGSGITVSESPTDEFNLSVPIYLASSSAWGTNQLTFVANNGAIAGTSSPSVTSINSTSTVATSTLANIIVQKLQALTSAGLTFFSNGGAPIADLGAGGGSNATFFGGVNIDGTTRLATSLTGLLQATSGTVSAVATSTLGLLGGNGTVGQVAFFTGAGTLGSTATGTISASGGLSVTAGRSAIGGALTIAPDTGFTIPTSTGLASLYVNSHVPVTLAGEDYLSLLTQQITANAIDPDNLSASDFGSFTCNGTTCTVDSGAISNAMLANSTVSYGGVSLSLGDTDATPAFNLADATGLPISTGVSGLGSGIATWLATPSSANLRSALTDETGTGPAVFASSSILTSPTLTSFFGTPCTGNEFLQDISDTGAFTCVAATGGGGGGGALSTTTDIVGDGAAAVVSYVTTDVMFGGSASTTAEFQFDKDGSKFIIASSSAQATTTITNANNSASIQFGVASSTQYAAPIVRGIHWAFQSGTDVILSAVGTVTNLVIKMNMYLATGFNFFVGATQWNSGDFIQGAAIASSSINTTSINGAVATANGGTGTTTAVLLYKPSAIQITSGSGAITTGDGKAYFRIPKEYAGMSLIDVDVAVTASSTAGHIEVQLARGRQASAGVPHTYSDMLSTAVTIDANEYDSAYSATTTVINTSNDDVTDGDLIRIDVDRVGSGPSAVVIVQPVFALP